MKGYYIEREYVVKRCYKIIAPTRAEALKDSLKNPMDWWIEEDIKQNLVEAFEIEIDINETL